ncbi:thioredoxin family protein [Rathayibacter sp. YIM 133350]|uniref:TlpA family protein disulfide reductase n=1 Tax=Rathayibacter sp. YIM 133350 TaxID=3131992 RepID=UPI00307ED07D
MVVALGIAAGLVALTAALGLVLRARQGRVRHADATAVVDPAELSPTARFGESATLLQFSTEFCSSCPQSRRVLASVAAARPGVVHLDVDLTHRPDLARRFAVLQTPTTLLLDRHGVVHARIGGAPAAQTVTTQLDRLIGGTA